MITLISHFPKNISFLLFFIISTPTAINKNGKKIRLGAKIISKMPIIIEPKQNASQLTPATTLATITPNPIIQ